MLKEHPIIGLGLLVFSSYFENIFVVKELQAKPEYGKRAGMLSFPIETVEMRDRNLLATAERIILEEVGLDANILTIHPQKFHPIPNRPDITIYYGIGLCQSPLDTIPNPTDTDIKFHGWINPKNLIETPRKSLRVEVIPIIWHYLTHSHHDYSLEFAKQPIPRT